MRGPTIPTGLIEALQSALSSGRIPAVCTSASTFSLVLPSAVCDNVHSTPRRAVADWHLDSVCAGARPLNTL